MNPGMHGAYQLYVHNLLVINNGASKLSGKNRTKLVWGTRYCTKTRFEWTDIPLSEKKPMNHQSAVDFPETLTR